ncbi:hypothetical protein [Nocardia sp. NPDC005825]|uniref:hypothetical protein n=1 Tax=unclassified Nocardia TaxID=2637762 RepID=UPI0033DF9086
MTGTELLAFIAFTVLVLQNAARVPAAFAELLTASQLVVYAARSLIAAIKDTPDPFPDKETHDDTNPPSSLTP